ncbi:radical SAM/SPASM domain-containing protein [Rhizobium puerariae]|uniref:Radical SAM/SPASM domain-containing protein n=1 Tax=Rhizobium puerariae TaxID=1585791 RepID=A0ABV6AJQ5_9HYPH
MYEPNAGKFFHIGTDDYYKLTTGATLLDLESLRIFYQGTDVKPRDIRTVKLAVTKPERPVLSAPLKVFLNITKKCNLFCTHCFNDSGHASSPEIPKEHLFTILDSLAARGIFKVTLAGGEPLFHPAFDDLIDKLDASDFFVSIVTNGICVTDRRAARLGNSRTVRSITISLDGANAADNDAIRGPSSFSKAVLGARRLSKSFKGDLSLRITLAQGNIGHVTDYVDLADELGIREIKVNRINAYGRAQNSPNLMIDTKVYENARDHLARVASSRGIAVEVPANKYRREDNGELGLCRAGEETCEIDGDGTLYPCSFTFGRLAAGNLCREPHSAVFSNLRLHTINHPWCYACKGRGGNAEKAYGAPPRLVSPTNSLPQGRLT